MTAYDSNELQRELRDIDYSCDHINVALLELEKTREINSDLRELIVKSLDALSAMESDYADLEDTNKKLRNQVEDLEREIEDLRDQLADVERHNGILQ